jgi:hypothetical protein
MVLRISSVSSNPAQFKYALAVKDVRINGDYSYNLGTPLKL